METNQLWSVLFFKQKTAYEIGLGIPAEPLFRSHLGNLFLIVQFHFSKLFLILKSGVNHTSRGSISTSTLPSIKLRRSEERRVGKESRSRWTCDDDKKTR